jgi:DNA (cytosine-5)-methyltransferase 1
MDILTAGFPCQPFSIAGQKEGFNDLRSNVFFTIMKIVEFHTPSCIVLENVKNLNTHDNGNTFKIILEHITRLGYTFKFKILNTLHITNIPHNRERIYIVCFKNPKHTAKFNFPDNTTDIIELKDFLHHDDVDDKYYYKNTLKVFNTINNNVTKHISTNTLYQFRRHYVRENKNSVCPTLTANMGTGGHNVPLLRDSLGIRKLTPRECFKLQGFPDSFIFPSISDSALYKLVGNAVTVSVVSKIATLIVDILNC